MPADLAQLDFAVPIGALDQPDHDPAMVLARQGGDPFDHRHGALGIGLQRQAKALPGGAEQLGIGDQFLDDVHRQFEPFSLFGIDGEVDVSIAGLDRERFQQRHQHRLGRFGMEEVIAREQG